MPPTTRSRRTRRTIQQQRRRTRHTPLRRARRRTKRTTRRERARARRLRSRGGGELCATLCPVRRGGGGRRGGHRRGGVNDAEVKDGAIWVYQKDSEDGDDGRVLKITFTDANQKNTLPIALKQNLEHKLQEWRNSGAHDTPFRPSELANCDNESDNESDKALYFKVTDSKKCACLKLINVGGSEYLVFELLKEQKQATIGLDAELSDVVHRDKFDLEEKAEGEVA